MATEEQNSRFKKAIRNAVDSFKGKKSFTSIDVTRYLRENDTKALDDIILAHGAAGRKNGKYATASTYIGGQLNSLSNKTKKHEKVLLSLGGIDAPNDANFGHDLIAAYRHVENDDIIIDVASLSRKDDSHPDEVSGQETYIEGAVIQVTVNRYERDSNARQECINSSNPKFTCKACNMNFGIRYGEKGNNFIHVHHIKPLSEIAEDYKVDPIKDLIQLCPNCHAMVHKGMTVNEIRKIFNLPEISC